MIGEWLEGLAHGVAGEWLVDTLLVTAALMAAVLVLRRPVARHFGAETAYLLWAIPLARLFMPPLTQTIEVPVSAPMDGDAAMAMPVAGAASLAETPAAESLGGGLLADADWFAIGVTVWLCGAAIFLIAQLAAYLQNRRELLDDAVPVARIGDIRVIEIAGIAGPFAFGLWRRYIALPIGFDRQYDPVERELALAHERSHHRAGDLWANFAALAMLSLHWFNPIAWAAWRAFRFDQEAACDARVLRQRSQAERTAYARAIAKAATGQTLAFASPLNPKDKIVERLKIMKQKEATRSRKWLGGTMIGTGLITAMAMTATVSYAIQPVLSPEIPEAPEAPEAPLAPEAPEAPEAPWAPEAPEAPPAPVIEDGVHVYTIKRNDGRKVVLRLDGPASRVEIDRMVADAERSRIDAERSVADAERARADAERHVRHMVVRSGAPGDQVIELGDGRTLRIQTSDCEGKSKSDAFMTHTETKGGTVVRSKVVTCGQVMPDEAELAAHIEKGMAIGMRQMAMARAEISRSPGLSASERAEALRDLDEGLREMREDLAEARRELRRELAEARREMREAMNETH